MDLDPMLGVKTMLKIATCPTCGTKVKCKGEPGEKKLVICPNCNNKGVVTFEKKDNEKIETFIPKEKPNKKTYSPRTAITIGVILILSTLFIWYIILPSAQGSTHFLIVLSGSMSPTIKPGDIVVSIHVNPEEIREGDIITFKDQNNQKNCITHRVVNILRDDEGNIYFRTKGDANEDPDINLVPSSLVIGRVTLVIPYLGYLPTFAKSKLGFITMIFVPGILIIINEILRMMKVSKEKKREIM